MSLDKFMEDVFTRAADVELNHIELVHDDDGQYYLDDLYYKLKLDGAECEMHYPKILLPIPSNILPKPYNFIDSPWVLGKPRMASLGELILLPDDNGSLLICKQHPRKVTLKELEKQLGYPIEIVNEEKEEK